MRRITRRTALASAFGLAAAAAAKNSRRPQFKIGVPDWSLDLTANPDAIARAKKIGFDGIQVSFGRLPVNGKLPLDNPEVIAQYLKLSAQNNIPIDGTCLDRLYMDVLKSDKAAPRWVSDGIRLTKALNSRVLMLPFSGRGELRTRAEIDYVGDALRELAPEAQKAGVILGLEDTLSAPDNVSIMERSKSPAVKVYYDVGNANAEHLDPMSEIRWLGPERICQMYLKDTGDWIGEGIIRYPPLIRAIQDIHFTGFANIDMPPRPGQIESDMRKNLAYVRDLENS